MSLGADLSKVRVHTGSESAEATRAVGAKAYTIGQDIHFGAGQYAPADPVGVRLLAHEVAHTVQNRGGASERQEKLEVSTPGDSAEVEAERAADAIVAGASIDINGATTYHSSRRRTATARYNWYEVEPGRCFFAARPGRSHYHQYAPDHRGGPSNGPVEG